MSMKTTIVFAAAAAALAGWPALAQGPEEPRAPQGERGDRFERGPRGFRGPDGQPPPRGPRGFDDPAGPRGPGGREFNPEQMRQRMRQFASARMKEQLNVTDEEWGLIEPLIDKVQEARRKLRMARGFGPADIPEESAVRTATGELRKALDAEGTEAGVIQEKLRALRAARAAGEEALKAAQEELRSTLTVRQEAQLVLMGILD